MIQAINRILYVLHLRHDGSIFAAGFACPTDKRNHALVILRGWRAIRRCVRCGEFFSRASDLIIPNLRPDAETVRAFAAAEGCAVMVEGDSDPVLAAA